MDPKTIVVKPPFVELPLRKDGPRGNAWGLFGPDDQCGMLNLLTADRVREAAKEIKDGIRISTDMHLDRLVKPFFGRKYISHSISHTVPQAMNDCTVQFNTQVGTQWDGKVQIPFTTWRTASNIMYRF